MQERKHVETIDRCIAECHEIQSVTRLAMGHRSSIDSQVLSWFADGARSSTQAMIRAKKRVVGRMNDGEELTMHQFVQSAIDMEFKGLYLGIGGDLLTVDFKDKPMTNIGFDDYYQEQGRKMFVEVSAKYWAIAQGNLAGVSACQHAVQRILDEAIKEIVCQC